MKLRRLAVFAAAAIAALSLSACSDNLTDLERAQAQVDAKQSAVDEAQQAFDKSSKAFCTASADYITALDKYGDILTDTAPTVGDVRNAGSELTAPKDAALDAAQDAVSAQSNLVTARQELADAEAALEVAKAGPSGGPSIQPSQVATPGPLAPQETLDRVKQAEQEFTDAQEGLADDTPLREAKEPFHSAAVALELSWMRLFIDTGCATDEQVKNANDAVTQYTKALQKDLKALEYYKGDVDGIYGPQTTQAVSDLQKANGLPQTGAMDIATAQALRDEMVKHDLTTATDEIASTAVLQQLLSILGYWDEDVDGIWSEELTAAVQEFQKDLGVDQTGEVDSGTISAFQKAVEDAKASLRPEEPSPEPSPTSSASASAKG